MHRSSQEHGLLGFGRYFELQKVDASRGVVLFSAVLRRGKNQLAERPQQQVGCLHTDIRKDQVYLNTLKMLMHQPSY